MPPIRRKRSSSAWNHFTSNADNTSAMCDICFKEVKTPKGATTGLLNHLSIHHDIGRKGVVNPGTDIMKSDEVISKLAAVDGLPFSVIANSSIIKTMYNLATHSSLPSSPNTVREIVLKHYSDIKSRIIEELKVCKTKKMHLSIQLDEWTSSANHRYMNVTVHSNNDYWNLGLARIFGSFTAEACLELLQNKLQEYDLSLIGNIFSISTDGAAVMKKFVRDSGRKQQLCLVHGIHLAVIDVLYNQNAFTTLSRSRETENPFDEQEEESFENPFNDASEPEIEYEPNLNEIISKVRKVVKIFRLSPLKMKVLNRHTENQATLLLDTKTRLNSLLAMLERFICLKDSIQKALIDVGEIFPLSDNDCHTVTDLVKILKPVKLAVESICRRDMTLILADAALQFMMQNLSLCDCELGRRLYDAMKRRIFERRSNLSEVASFLHYGNDDEMHGHRDGYFAKLSRQNLINDVKTLYEDFVLTDEMFSQTQFDDCPLSQSLLSVETHEVSLEDQLNFAINKAKSFEFAITSSRPTRSANGTLMAAVKKEISSLETTGIKGKIIKSVYDMLMTVCPCTVESERAFSVANNFCRKTRSKLGDNALNALVVLKYYYLKIAKML